MSYEGWIKLNRKLLANPRFKDSEWVTIWIYLILSAAHRPIKVLFKGKTIELLPGQLAITIRSLSDSTGINRGKIDRILKVLESETQIVTAKSNTNTIVTICKWDKYQSNEERNFLQVGQQMGNNCDTTVTRPFVAYKDRANTIEQELKNIYHEDFDRFWILYDKKVGDKSKIYKKWLKLKDVDKIKIFATLSDYVASTPDKKFRKNPEVYLNNHSWNDEIIISRLSVPLNISNSTQPKKYTDEERAELYG
jgi:predicted transcriptional regulator